ncbi:MAG: aldo/keto reductase [Comamonadaceae bacterium]|nr:MAG: aldo/keto reductase [Comamonadaceae bacterium]
MRNGVLSLLKGTAGLGFGGAPLGNLYSALDDESAGAALERAWALGLRYFDTAPLYGHGLSETRIGRMLAGKPRGSFTVSTKVGRLLRASAQAPPEQAGYVAGLPFTAHFDYSAEGALRSIEQSLRRLDLARVDIAYIHDIDRATHGHDQPLRYREAMGGAYRALAQLRTEGVVGAIGLGVNEWEVCDAALGDADFDCFMLAGRYTLLDQSALRTLVPRCLRQGVPLVLGGVFNSGILATGAVDGARYDYQDAGPAMLARVRRLDAVCAQHGVALRAAALQFAMACPAAAVVVVGCRTAAEVEDAVAMSTRAIPPALWAQLKDLA